MRPRLVNGPDLANVLALDAAVMPMLAKMEATGMRVDLDALARTDAKLADLQSTADMKMEKLIGHKLYAAPDWKGGRFNPKSGDQIAKLLFEKLGIPEEGLKRTKKQLRVKVDKKALEKVRERHPIVPLLMEYTELAKLRDAFTIPIPRMVGRDGRVRPQIRYTRVATGRLAMARPNLMQIPTRTELGRLIRNCFIPADGCVFLSVDQSQIEMRIAAHISEDPGMMSIFLNGEDMHWKTAHGVYGLPIPADPDNPQPGELTQQMRTVCKNVGFGILYGITAKGLYDQIVERITDPVERAKWSVARCEEELIAGYYDTYPGVARMVREFQRIMRLYGYIWDWFGRVRLTPGVRSADSYIVEKALREGGNHPIQGTAQGTMKLAMADVWPMLEGIESAGKTCRTVLQVHDELIVEVEKDIAEDVSCVVKECVEGAIELKVPIGSGASIGESWGALK